MGLLDGLFGGDQPQYQAPSFSAEGQAGMDFVKANADRTPDQVHEMNMKGVGGKEFLATQHDQKSADESLGMGNNEAARAALSARASKHYDSSFNQVENKSKINSVSQAIQSKSVSDHLVLRKKAIDSAVAHHQSMASLQESAARNSVLSGVLGAAGSFAGMAMAGGGGGMPAPSSSGGANFGGLVGKQGGSDPYGLGG